jgi:hypothetical protein
MAVDIKKHIFCELVHAIKFVNKNLRINDGPSIPESYGGEPTQRYGGT